MSPNDPARPTEALYEIRKLAIVAMFADDVLFPLLALKGGNALDIVLGIAGRASVDIDFSIKDNFEDLADIRRRVEKAIIDRFDSAGYEVFDFSFEERPTVRREGMPVEWGGYEIQFKIIRKATVKEIGSRKDRMFARAEDVGPGFQKNLTIQISHHEYTEGKIEKDLDDYTVVVYTPTMIAIEKLRAICQQMSEYGMTQPPRPRARDFYDIYRICEGEGVRLDTSECGELLEHIFAAKLVPLALLEKVSDHRRFHEQNWGEVVAAAREKLAAEDFDFYFDYVLQLINKLKLPRNK